MEKIIVFQGDSITDAGREALEPYRVKRAVFLAAGFGYRLVPVTLNTPKPLVRVKGTRMIDTLLDAVVTVTTEEAYAAGRRLGAEEGVLAGISAGAALHVALELAKQEEHAGKTIVALLPDTGERYLSTDLFSV